ncbi:DUF1176 domain-containing protein [Nitratireductor basaltis]|uniref:DUF1176 domain-containing protein n=1 Tax=Nitratireductor basaltis TaxID=472175 RepID=A0A084UBD6_9HYPH|nr:DUF1176 domain-containing protein [Nitratireductor basaltis]KFB10272.1 hypothetical protein EL18_01303 [Nitratireductor basaltis]
MKRLCLSLASLAVVSVAHAQTPPFLDNRSTPQTLVESLYNAINRREYSRAFSYFETPPAADFQTYAQGFEGTERVDLHTGKAVIAEKDGTRIYHLPAAIAAHQEDGSSRLFAGCYEIAAASEGENFQPLRITSTQFTTSDAEVLEGAVPEDCAVEGEVVETDSLAQSARDVFTTVYGEACLRAREEGLVEPDEYTISYILPYDSADQPKREKRLFRFFCDRGAYNETHVYLAESELGGVVPLRFASPDIVVDYENGDPEGEVEEIRITGYGAQDMMVNSEFDPQEQTITTFAKWRGLGDASSSGIWLFREGEFHLVQYSVDASYDGESNPELLLDYFTGP